MAINITALDDRDRRLIQELIRTSKSARPPVGRELEDLQDDAPEVYVARTPVGGIDGLQEETGTGINDRPGYATCNIYRILSINSIPTLFPIPSLTKRVYNLSHDRIGGNRWVMVTRDKLGSWYTTMFPEDTDTGTGTFVGAFISTGTGSGCQDIPGFDHNALPISVSPDYVLGIENGCLVRVAVGACP